MSHLAAPLSVEIVPLERPFSSFEFVEQCFHGSAPIRKLFSISRGRGGATLVVETVPAVGRVAEENEDLARLDRGFAHIRLVRISFWKARLTEADLPRLRAQDCLGYALLKRDWLTVRGDAHWHIYEALFRPYPHAHNYVNARAVFPFVVAGVRLEIEGCLYAQQNGVNKTCAQVGIRSLVSTYFGTNDLSYRRINELAAASVEGAFTPGDGLTNRQIAAVLTGLGVEYVMMDYHEIENDPDPERRIGTIREDVPYQKLLYSGIESGSGALMAFSLSGPAAPATGHLIPFFGHTFNEDSWVPNAEPAYFRLGESIAYVPSRSWLSSFLAHDDNFGMNLCIPQAFIDRKNVSCVFELLPRGWCYSGVEAEFAAANYFYSILPSAPDAEGIPWLRRLRAYVEERPWPEELWMIEVSVPEVFPTNKRKLGEILLDATRDLSDETDGMNFVLARLPGYFVFFDSLDAAGVPSFVFSPNALKSHMRVHSNGAMPAEE